MAMLHLAVAEDFLLNAPWYSRPAWAKATIAKRVALQEQADRV
ncbi:hypothetical protein SNOG_16285 [Parastagonospora nodorum SN15]|uniref:Uncharacterized protein n=1 Tax=Phaeosphaeria nodorum (strain SN15 / ATCC MYA-4574 / FGSC 10173) TaxID=321614 RepID=Q0TVW8_PHANO|nr:hypothetical protein SNOG_16285 [Parastagonospora nodorum SN15]EAT76271.1 hypothetical protein SNOG_16285 [Parastagonospora nodorum SN15]